MEPLDRRTFLLTVAAASAGSALVPGVLQAASANADAGAGRIEWHKAPCALCAVGCGLLVGIEGGRAVAVKGDIDSPVSRGLACVKGYYAAHALYGGDRILRAQLRRGGKRVAVPIEEAYAAIAHKLRETIRNHGKDSVAMYGSADWSITDAYAATKLFKGGLGTNNVDTSARLYSASATAGQAGSVGVEGALGCFEDIEHADVIVLWDHNIAESDPVLFSRMLERRRTNRLRIIDLSSRTTRTSYGADRALICSVNSEAVLANAVCREIVVRGMADKAFVDKYVAFKKGGGEAAPPPTGEPMSAHPAEAADWKQFIAFLGAYTPARVQADTGLSTADVRWLASLYGDRALKVLSVTGTSLNQHAQGTLLINLIHNIHLLTGRIATPGNGVLGLGAQPAGGAAVHNAGAAPDALPRGMVDSASDRKFAANLWHVPAERIDARPGHSALGMFRALESGDVRFLWIQGSNPMVSLPNLRRYRQALTRADRFIVVSDAYPTATTDIADVVLPAALWVERAGIYGNAERRLQLLEQVVQPPGDACSYAWQSIEVGRHLGLRALLPWSRATHCEEIWREYANFHAQPDRRVPAVAALRTSEGVIWPVVEGKETKWRCATATDPAAGGKHGDFDFYGHPDHRAWIWLHDASASAETRDEQYPFWLATGVVLEHSDTGELTRRIPVLHRAVPTSYAELNATDAKQLGVRNGDMVRLISRRGSIILPARVNHRSQPARGQVFVPAFDDRMPVNILTPDGACVLSGQPGYQACAVRVERAP